MNISSNTVGAISSIVTSTLPPLPTYVPLLISLIVYAILLGIIVSAFSYLFGWVERKLVARMHARHGPTYVGKYGLLQNMADVLKLISKENIVPDRADKHLFPLILPIVFAMFVVILGVIPFTDGFVGINTTLGLLLIFIILSFSPLLLFLAAWTSGNKFGSISAQRSVVLLVSYEIPLVLIIATIAMLASSFSLQSIVNAQQGYWYALLMPIGLVVFFVVMLAELERAPFDLREADSELIAGWLTDVSAPYYGLALFLDYSRMFVGSLLIALLFFGGWLGPQPIPPIAWLILKTTLIAIFIIGIRAALVRMRMDRVLRTGWLFLTPLAIVNLLITFMIFIK